MEKTLVGRAIQPGVGQKYFRGTAFHGDREYFGTDEILAGLGGQDHSRVFFAPGFQRADDVGFDHWMPEKTPSFVDEKDLELGRRRLLYGGCGAVKHVEEQGFQLLGGLVHAVEIERLKARQVQIVAYM